MRTIEEGILAEFLIKNRAEVIPKMIYECNMEEELKKIGNDKYEDGFQDGRADVIIKLIKSGMSCEQISEILELSLDEVKNKKNNKAE